MRTLRRISRWMQFYRRKNESDTNDVASILINRLEGHQWLHGYKLDQLHCIQAEYIATHSAVRPLHKIHEKKTTQKPKPTMYNMKNSLLYVTIFTLKCDSFTF